jgi:hypothetical protein
MFVFYNNVYPLQPGMATGLVDDLSNEKISNNFLFRNLKITLVKPDNMLHLWITNIVIQATAKCVLGE